RLTSNLPRSHTVSAPVGALLLPKTASTLPSPPARSRFRRSVHNSALHDRAKAAPSEVFPTSNAVRFLTHLPFRMQRRGFPDPSANQVSRVHGLGLLLPAEFLPAFDSRGVFCQCKGCWLF